VQCNSLLTQQLHSELLERIYQSWVNDLSIQQIIQDIQEDSKSRKHYRWSNSELGSKGKLVVGKDLEIRSGFHSEKN